jgi:hypothetical protein
MAFASGIQRSMIALSVLAATFAGCEVLVNRAGPGPGPTESSRAAGLELLRGVVRAHDAGSWEGRDSVRVAIESKSLGRPLRQIDMTLDPVHRSASFRYRDDPGRDYYFDGATEAVLPAGAPRTRELETMAPSLVFWSMVPGNLLDGKAVVWRLPESDSFPRLAVRWPGQVEWFVFEIDPADSTIRSLEFIDERLTPVFRWRGVMEGRTTVDGVVFPETWRFVPARRLFSFLSGGRDLVVLRYRPIV